jgi:hypothetical protein
MPTSIKFPVQRDSEPSNVVSGICFTPDIGTTRGPTRWAAKP